MCDRKFHTRDHLDAHVEAEHAPKGFTVYSSALSKSAVIYRKTFPPLTALDVATVFVEAEVEEVLRYELIRKKNIKFSLIPIAEMIRMREGVEEERGDFPLRTLQERLRLGDIDRVERIVSMKRQNILERLDSLEEGPGSGWILVGFKKLDIEISALPSLRGASATTEVDKLIRQKIDNKLALCETVLNDTLGEDCFYHACARSFFPMRKKVSIGELERFIKKKFIKLVRAFIYFYLFVLMASSFFFLEKRQRLPQAD